MPFQYNDSNHPQGQSNAAFFNQLTKGAGGGRLNVVKQTAKALTRPALSSTAKVHNEMKDRYIR